MAVIEKKPDIRELVGIAVNTSALDSSPTHERAVDRVAALGAAALEVSLGADLAGLPIAAMVGDVYRRSADMRDVMLDPGTPDERDQLAGELGPLLWHIRYGAQHELLSKAVKLFARWLKHRRLFAEIVYPEPPSHEADHVPLLERFAARSLHEWLSDRCIACGGCGKLERTRTGAWIRPRGSMQRNATFRPCTGCHGSGQARSSDIERARWLEMPRATYEAERWGQRFNAALIWLKQFHVGRLQRPLTEQLERRKKRG